MAKLLRATVGVSLALWLRGLLQGLVFLIIARSLGVSGYGDFVVVLAACTMTAPFVGWGQELVLLGNVARVPEKLNEYWYSALRAIALTAIPAILLMFLLLVEGIEVRVSAPAVLAILFAEYFFGRIAEMAVRLFQARQALRKMAMLRVFLPATRLGVAILMVLTQATVSPSVWCYFYLAASVLTCSVSYFMAMRAWGPPMLPSSGTMTGIGGAHYFAVSAASERLNNDVDKVMLGQMSGSQSAGTYSAAYRLFDLVNIPVVSLLTTLHARFFRAGAQGVDECLRLARQILPYPCLYAAVAGALLFLAAPLLPWILGVGYEESTEVVRWFFALPLLITLQRFAALSLDSSGHQRQRSVIQGGTAMLNIVLNLIMIPRMGWQGAVFATLIAETVLVTSLWGAVLRHPKIKP